MKKILVAEDDKFLANALRVKFTKASFEVKLVTDGVEAIEALKTFTPDVILLDLIMPKKDGFEVLKELRGNQNWKNIPVVVASNLGQKEDADKAKSLGAREYLVKTDLSIGEIVEKVKTLAR